MKLARMSSSSKLLCAIWTECKLSLLGSWERCHLHEVFCIQSWHADRTIDCGQYRGSLQKLCWKSGVLLAFFAAVEVACLLTSLSSGSTKENNYLQVVLHVI